MTARSDDQVLDVALIGSGIMSATLGVLLKQLQPNWKMEIFERLDRVAIESSDAWNNAGTGHAALCELNYTPEKPDGTIDTTKAVKINEQFELSKQFWAYLVEHRVIATTDFIHPVPHMSFVTGDKDVAYLKKRHAALAECPLFKDMKYTEDHETLDKWLPLVMHGRKPGKVAATRVDQGTDVDFGTLTRSLISNLSHSGDSTLHLSHEVKSLKRSKDGAHWVIRVRDLAKGETRTVRAKFVFLGAGGGTLHLLEKSHIPEAKGYGGFPVSGLWLRCTNPDVIAKHHAKVYGKAAIGAPPMSVPHLDSRVINGKQELLFGPFAGFSTRFLKKGSYLDLPASVRPSNIIPMLEVGVHSLSLVRYLIQQLRLSGLDRIEALREYYPEARPEDWVLSVAGQRVQVIKKNEQGHGVLEFGTELVRATDGSIAALLGASPGASTAVAVALDVLRQCFPEQSDSPKWQKQLSAMIPSYGKSLAENKELLAMIRKHYSTTLHLRS